MRKLIPGLRPRGLALLACALGFSGLAVVGASGASANTVAAPHAVTPAAAAAPSIGVDWYPTPNGNAGQCGEPPTGQTQWAASPNWTYPITIDTDNRVGGCQLAFGVYDPSNTLSGVSMSYTWTATAGGDAGQCGNPGTYQMPIGPFQTFGGVIIDDTDNRPGFCWLTFSVTDPSNTIGLDVEFYPTPNADAGQCNGYKPAPDYYTAFNGSPVTIGLDTDGRGGGCELSLRIEKAGFAPRQPSANAHGLAVRR